MAQQPTLPPEGAYTQVEQLFIEESPPNLWPENQDSNLGLIRKIVTDPLQEVRDTLLLLYNERFVATSTDLISDWETEMLLPRDNINKALSQRRADVLSRLKKGTFTMTRLEGIIESFITAALGGTPVELTPSGVELTAAGVPLYSGVVANVKQLYRVYMDFMNFAYEVRIRNDVDPDLAGMLRELKRISPASFTLTQTEVVNVLDYAKRIKHMAPVLHLRLGSGYTDSSGLGMNGTAFGTIAAVADPGLLETTAISGGNGASDFDGSTGYVTVPDHPLLDLTEFFHLEVWLRPDAIGSTMVVFDKSTNGYEVRINTGGFVEFRKSGGSVIATSTQALVAGTKYKIGIRKRLTESKIFINGLDKTGTVTDQTIEVTPSHLRIGQSVAGGNFFNGVMDEIVFYNYNQSEADDLATYNTGRNIA